jgi:hypothetical protein
MESEESSPIEQAGIVSVVATSGVLPADESASVANVLITQPLAPAATKPSPADPRPDTAATAAPVTLTLHATAEVWIEATADGQRVAYELLPQGARKTLTAQKTLSMRIGDAGAVQYTVNGVPGTPLGGPGAVRDLHLSSDNVAPFQAGR